MARSVPLNHVDKYSFASIVNVCCHMRSSSFNANAPRTGFGFIDAQMVGKVVLMAEGVLSTLLIIFLEASHASLVRAWGFLSKARDYIVVFLDAYIRRAAACNGLLLIKGLPVYILCENTPC